MGANNALPPTGDVVTVEPARMVELLNQWQGHQNRMIIPLEVEFVAVDEFYPIILHSPTGVL